MVKADRENENLLWSVISQKVSEIKRIRDSILQTSADSTVRVPSLSRFCPEFRKIVSGFCPDYRKKLPVVCPAGQGRDRAVGTLTVLVRRRLPF